MVMITPCVFTQFDFCSFNLHLESHSALTGNFANPTPERVSPNPAPKFFVENFFHRKFTFAESFSNKRVFDVVHFRLQKF